MEINYTKVSAIRALATGYHQKDFIFDWQTIVTREPDALFVLAKQHDRIVGLINFKRITNDSFNRVYDLEVTKSARGQHIGIKLLALVMQDSFEQGFDGYVNLITKTNGVEKFYQHLGGIRFGQYINFNSITSSTIIDRYSVHLA